jgi:type II secretory pathway predicted ATPase ExeA
VLEEIRLFGNYEMHGHKLLQVVLAGQPELEDVLSRPELSQLRQRIALRFRLQPLSRDDVSEYLSHRWKRSGGNQFPFDTAALHSIASLSRGIPRVINAIADHGLMSAYAEGSRHVGASHLAEACRDLAIGPNGLTMPKWAG